MAWGGDRRSSNWKQRESDKKPNPRKERTVATTKLPDRSLTVPAEPRQEPRLDMRKVSLSELEEISRRYSRHRPKTPSASPFRLPTFPKEATPPDSAGPTLAMDEGIASNVGFATNAWQSDGYAAEGLEFLGYAYLAELAQVPENRIISETIADDATRKWIDFDVVGDEKNQAEARQKDPEGFDERMADPDERAKRILAAGKTDKVKALKDDQDRLEVKSHFYNQARNDGFFGQSHLFLDIGENGDDPTEMTLPIGNGRDAISRAKVQKGSFRRLQTIEPVWTYPLAYNAINPLAPDWYNPQNWYVMGRQIHCSRLLTFIGHPVPDMLKPAYAFGGMSLTQIAKPYVDIWRNTSRSVADLVHSFSVMVLCTDLSTLLQEGTSAADLMARVAMFNMLRDNQGAFVINKATEDFKNVSASLSGLHELQAQAQEHVSAVARLPLVKFTGITPSGLNPSAESEIEVYDDTISAYQERFFRPGLERVINFQQLSLFGEIDPDITWHFETLRVMTEAEKGQKLKDEADTRQKYVDMGAFSPAEIRKVAIDDPDLPFTDLDPEDVPEAPAEEGLLGPGAGGAAEMFEAEQGEPGAGEQPAPIPAAKPGEG
jgi:phage-related protein (TIGR01555 family)